MKTRNIVLIHGMYMNPLCWEKWIEYFGSQGYRCLAPAWPGRDLPVETSRKNHPDPQLGRLDLSAIIRHISNVIETVDEKPVVIGHSMGGLVVQMLLQKNLAVAGVAIDSAPPMGVFTAKWPFLKANWPHINPFKSQGDPIEMSFERFQYAFVNTLTLPEQRAAYDRYVVPESRRVPREALTTKINFKKPHPPLLLIAGSADHLIPASLNKSNYNKYRSSPSVIGFKEYPGRPHFTIGQDGWQELADYSIRWLEDQGI
jgi:pimeloyl-ACP methyl ester carboxylesterase